MPSASFFRCAPHLSAASNDDPGPFTRVVELRRPLGTEANEKHAEHAHGEPSALASNIIGYWTVVGGAVCFGLLIWLGL